MEHNAQKWAFQNFASKAWLKGKEAKEDNGNDWAVTSLLGVNSLSGTPPVEIVGRRCLMLVRNLPQVQIANQDEMGHNNNNNK